MAKKFPANPPHPERVCWGCDVYCPADAMSCGNGAERTPHPAEFWGPDWEDWQPVKLVLPEKAGESGNVGAEDMADKMDWSDKADEIVG